MSKERVNIVKCRSCGAGILWMLTSSKRMIPVDAATCPDHKAEVFDPKTMTSHFATCPDAAKWRKHKI